MFDPSGTQCSDLNTVLRVYNAGSGSNAFENRHVVPYNFNPGDYDLKLCCYGQNSPSGHESLAGNVVARIYQQATPVYGLHLEQNDRTTSDYTNIHYGSSGNSIECINSGADCAESEGYICMFRLYQETDSHIADCSTSDAPIRVCCRQTASIRGWVIQGNPWPNAVNVVPNPDPSTLPDNGADFGGDVVRIEVTDPGSITTGIRTIEIPGKGMTFYEASVWVYIPAGMTITGTWLPLHMHARLASGGGNFEYLDLTPNADDEEITDSNTPKGEWVRKRFKFRTNADVETLVVHFITDNSGGSGTVYADGFNLIELAGNRDPEDDIPFFQSDYNFGCCYSNQCWNGVSCEYTQDIRTEINSEMPEPFCNFGRASSSQNYTNWTIPYKSYFWFSLKDTGSYPPTYSEEYSQYCPVKGQCWKPGSSYPSTAGELCMLPGEEIGGFVCSPELIAQPNDNEYNWSTRSKILFANLLNAGASLGYTDDYTIMCDSANCWTDNPTDPNSCRLRNITCIFRHEPSNTIIIGGLIDSFDVSGTFEGTWTNSNCYLANQEEHPAIRFIARWLGMDYGNLGPYDPPVRFESCFNSEDQYTNGIIIMPTSHPIKSIGYNNLTKIVLISNNPSLDYTLLGQGLDTSVIQERLIDLKYYEDDPNLLPPEMSNNYPATFDLLPLFTQDKFYNTIFYHRAGQKRATLIVEKESNSELFMSALYYNYNTLNNACENIQDNYTYYSYYPESGPKPSEPDLDDWFSCILSQDGTHADMFSLLNNLYEPEMPVYARGTPTNSQKWFANVFWKNITYEFRNFAQCTYRYNFVNLTVPGEFVSDIKEGEFVYYQSPSAEGCCYRDSCWNGQSCVQGFGETITSFGQGLFGTNPSAIYAPYSEGREINYVCRYNATKPYGNYVMNYSDWDTAYRRDMWNFSSYGYCLESSQCWDGVQCQPNEYIAPNSNYLCNNGNWTSKTHLLALTLLNISEHNFGKGTNFTLACENALPLSRINRTMIPCLLYDNDKGYFMAAMSPINRSAGAEYHPERYMEDALGIMYGLIQCHPENLVGYTVCTFNSAYEGPIRSAIWNKRLNILVLSNAPNLGAPAGDETFLVKLWNWFLRLLGIQREQTAPSLSNLQLMINKTKDFERIFYRQDNRTHNMSVAEKYPTYIESIRERHDIPNNYTAFLYSNVNSTDVCLSIQQLVDATIQPYLDEIYGCSREQHFALYNYSIFAVHSNAFLYAPNDHTFDDLLWKWQIHNFTGYFSCFNSSYHDAYLPQRVEYLVEPYEHLLFNQSTMASCCFDNSTCWTGRECVPEYFLMNYSGVGDENLFVCVDGDWTNASKRWDWDDLTYDYCAHEWQCYLPQNSYDSVRWPGYDMTYNQFRQIYLDGRDCTNENFKFFHDKYCLSNGNWTTRTALVASAMLNYTHTTGVLDPAIQCGHYNKTLNTVFYQTDTSQTLVEDYIRGTMGTGNLPYGLPRTNYFCVLTYEQDGQRRVAVGTSLNNMTNVSEYLGMTVAGQLANECDGDEADRFAACDPANYPAPRIWLDNYTQLVIYNRDGMMLGEISRLQAFINWLSNPVRSIVDFIRGLFTQFTEKPTEVFEFNRYYRITWEDPESGQFKEIIGAVRDKNAEERYIVVSFDNTTAHVCDYIHRYNSTLVCEGEEGLGNYTVTSSDFSLMDKIFRDLTSKLRPVR